MQIKYKRFSKLSSTAMIQMTLNYQKNAMLALQRGRKIINNGNRTEWSPILSVTIQVIIKKDPEFSSLTIWTLYLLHESIYM